MESWFDCMVFLQTFGYKAHLKRHVAKLHALAGNALAGDALAGDASTGGVSKRESFGIHRRRVPGKRQGAQILCSFCGRIFSQRSNLNRHVTSVHQGVRYSCPVCPKSFGQRFDLHRHVERCVESGDASHRGTRVASL